MKTNLLKLIEAKQTGNRAYSESNFIDISRSFKSAEDYRPTMAKEYYIGVNLGAHVYIDEFDGDAESLREATKNVGRMVAKEVYGEIREELINFRYELYNKLGFRDREFIKKLDEIIEMTHYE